MTDFRISDFSEAVAQDERFLAEQLFDYFHPEKRTGPCEWNRLYFALGTLLSSHLRLDPFWPSDERWIDNTGFLIERTSSDNVLRLVGYINWGFVENASNGIYQPFDAELRLLQKEPMPAATYVIRFCCDNITRRVTPSGIEWDLADGFSSLKPDAVLFQEIVVGRFTNDLRTLPTAVGSHGLRLEPRDESEANAQQMLTAAVCLAKCGRDGRELLLETLRHPSPDVRCVTLQALGWLAREQEQHLNVPEVSGLLNNEDTLVRCLAASWLVLFQNHDPSSPIFSDLATDFLEVLAADDNRLTLGGFLSRGALEIIKAQILADPRKLPTILDSAHQDALEQFFSYLLSELGENAVAAIPMLASELRDNQGRAGWTLWQIGTPEARKVLRDCLKEPNSEACLQTLRILQSVESDQSFIQPLKRLFNKKHLPKDTQWQVVKALAGVEPRSDDVRIILRRTAKRLIEEFPEAETDEQWDILQLLERIGPQAVEAVPLLVSVVKGAFTPERNLIENMGGREKRQAEELSVRAIETLGAVGKSAIPAIPALVELLEFEMEDYRWTTRHVLETLGKMGNPGIEAIIGVLSRKPDHISEWYDFREPLKEAGPMVVPKLLEAFDKPAVCSCALKILPSFGPQAAEAAPVIRELLAHPDPSVRVEAAVCLSKIGPEIPETINDLTKLLDDSDAEVRCAALSALQRFGPSAELVAAVKRYAKLEDSVARKVLDRSIKARRN